MKELEEEEITKKGFWRKKLELVEKLLTRQQAKDLALLLQQVRIFLAVGFLQFHFCSQEKEGSKEYMEKLEKLLIPKEEIHEEPETKEEAMDCSEVRNKEELKVKEEKVIKFGKTDEEYEEKVAAGGDGPSSSSKRSSEKKSKKEKGQISVMDMFKRAPAKKAVEKRKSSEKEEEQPGKRVKEGESLGPELREKVVVASEKPKIERCSTCRQLVEQTLPYLGHPHSAVEEFVGIVDKRLSLFEDGENQIALYPCYLTQFSCSCFVLRYGWIRRRPAPIQADLLHRL